MKKFLFNVMILCTLLTSQHSKAQTQAQSAVDARKEWAIQVKDEFGIPASIILAIAMYESANGTSKVATYLNNHLKKEKTLNNIAKRHKTIVKNIRVSNNLRADRSKMGQGLSI